MSLVLLSPKGMQAKRQQLLGAKIVFNNRSCVFDCMVRALSADGAVLRMNSTMGIPSIFELFIKPFDKTYICDLSWRSETEIGAAFRLSPHQPAAALRKGLHLVK